MNRIKTNILINLKKLKAKAFKTFKLHKNKIPVIFIGVFILITSLVYKVNNNKQNQSFVKEEANNQVDTTPGIVKNNPVVVEEYTPKFFTEEELKGNLFPQNWKTFSIKDLSFSIKYPDHWAVTTWGSYYFTNNEKITSGSLIRATARLTKDMQCMYSDDDCTTFEVWFVRGRDEELEANMEPRIINGLKGYVYSYQPITENEFFTFLANDGKNRIIIKVGTNKISDELITEVRKVISSISLGPVGNNYQFSSGWALGNDNINTFVFSYPIGYGFTGADKQVRISQIGPTQVSDTEAFDTMFLTIDLKELQNQSIKEFVAQSRNDYLKSDDWKSIEGNPKAEVTEINEIEFGSFLKGYFYTVSGYGTYDNIFLQPTGANKIFVIMKAVQDPSGQGFEEAANKIITSLKII